MRNTLLAVLSLFSMSMWFGALPRTSETAIAAPVTMATANMYQDPDSGVL